MRKKILIGLGALVAVLAVFALVVAMQPATFKVQRSATIAAPPPIVFEQVNDFHKWQAWSPWAKLDPDAKNTFEGPAAGKGAVFSWSGNSDVGAGRMEIIESRPNELILLKLHFLKPFEDTADTEFKFTPVSPQASATGERTTVTWTMTGENDFIAKAMCMFMSMDKLVGGSFEEGLFSMKRIAEAAAKK